MLKGIFVLIDYFKNFEKLLIMHKNFNILVLVWYRVLYSAPYLTITKKNDSKLEKISDFTNKQTNSWWWKTWYNEWYCLWALHEWNTYRNIIRAFLAFCWIMILYSTHGLNNWWSTHIYIVMDMFKASIMHYSYSVYVYTYII